MERRVYKPNEFATMIGVSTTTLSRWDRSGLLKACRTPTNRPFYTDEQYDRFMGCSKESVKEYDVEA